MTYIIAEPCIDVTDTACVTVCPVDCIYINDPDGPAEKENDAPFVEEEYRIKSNGGLMDILLIHPEECIDCGACEPECPVEAIFPEDEVPEKWAEYTPLNYQAFGMSP